MVYNTGNRVYGFFGSSGILNNQKKNCFSSYLEFQITEKKSTNSVILG
jgi:hypothetical protein